MDEQDTRQNTVEEICGTKCFIVSVVSFHVYFNKQVHYKLEKNKQAKKLKAWILLNQTRTEKQTRAAALRHTIYFFSLIDRFNNTCLNKTYEEEGLCANGSFFTKIVSFPLFPYHKLKQFYTQ